VLVEGGVPPAFTVEQTVAVATEAAFWRLDALRDRLCPRRDAVAAMPDIVRVYTQAEFDHLIDRYTPAHMAGGNAVQKFANTSFAGLHFFATPCVQGWTFRECDLRDTNIVGCELGGCDFTGSNLAGVDLSACTGTDGINLSNANLEGTQLPRNIQKWNLTGANLAGVDLSACTGPSVNLSNANLVGARLPRSIASWNFNGANLGGVDLSACRGTGVNLCNANLEGAQLPAARDVLRLAGWQM